MLLSERAADLIVLGATIHTSEAANPSPQAFAVRDGRFAYVGSTGGAMGLRGPRTQIVDALGRTVLPGLIDAHLHLTRLGLTLLEADLRGARSEDEAVARVAGFARGSSDAWVLGNGWDQNLWASGAFPTRASLSAAIADRPAALSRVDGHALWANAKAMALAGVDAGTADPPGGRIVRDAGGNPTGVLVDAAQDLVYARVPAPSHERLVAATRAAIARCNRWGVTAVAEPGASDAVLRAHADLIERGEYSIRNHVMLYDDGRLDAHFADGITDGAHDGRIWIRAVKMFADGALGSRGAALLEPYSDDAGNAGLLVTPRERLESVTSRALRAGFQPCIHAIGDRANRMVLDVYESLLGSRDEVRPRIEHAQVLDRQDLPRLARLGVVASVQAIHYASDASWAPSRLGSQRMAGAYAWRRLLDAGTVVANGSDAPVEPVDTPRGFHAAVSAGPQRQMTRREALDAMTVRAAYANFQDGVIGSIAPGKHADFVIVDRDWMSAELEEILQTEVLATYFGGRPVYRSEGSTP